jgi:hypothetical protein
MAERMNDAPGQDQDHYLRETQLESRRVIKDIFSMCAAIKCACPAVPWPSVNTFGTLALS